MKKVIYIHVGAGKTGTSAIQEFLFLNEKKLENYGIYLPTIGREKSDKYLFHHELAGGKEKNFNFKSTIALWEKVALSEKKITLVTSEIFHSRIKDEKINKFFYQIKQILKDFDIKIIFYIRREIQWIESAYKEWIKSGLIRNGQTLDDFIKIPRMSLGEQILIFADIFGRENIIVRPYEKNQFKNSNIFCDFFHILGVPLDDSFVYPKYNPNPRLSNEILEFKRIFNSICLNRNETETILPYLNSYSRIFDDGSSHIFQTSTLLSPALRKKFESENEFLYKRIASEFLGREDGELFIEEINNVNTEYFNFNTEHLTRIISFILLELLKDKK